MNYPMILGEDERGSAVVADLQSSPNLLITGIAGSGKTMAVHQLILSLMYKNQPDLLKFIMVDPIGVEFAVYKDNPYMLTNPIKDMQVTYRTLKSLKTEMEMRHRVLKDMSARTGKAFKNIDELNTYHIRAGQRKMVLPHILVIIDELADLIHEHEETDRLIAGLCQVSKMSGIHLLLITQTPRQEVVSPLIKANIPSRWAFMSANVMESQISIDEPGAEKLRPYGDFLFRDNGQPLQHGQSIYIPNNKLEELTALQRSRWVDEVPKPRELMFSPRTRSLHDALPEMNCFKVFDDLIPDTKEETQKQSIVKRLLNLREKSSDVPERGDIQQFINEKDEQIKTYLASKGVRVSKSEIYRNTRVVSFRYGYNAKDNRDKCMTGVEEYKRELASLLGRDTIIRLEDLDLIVSVYLPKELSETNTSKFPELLKQLD